MVYGSFVNALCNCRWLFGFVLTVCFLFGAAPASSQEPEADTAAETEEEGVTQRDTAEGDAAEESTEESTEEAGHEGAVDHSGGDHQNGEHHDETDLTHANASEQLAAASEMRFDHVLGTLMVFAVLFAILAKLAWKPITQGLDAREEKIKTLIEEAERNHEAAAARLSEYETRLLAAAEESRALIAQAQKDAERAAERIKAEAEEAAQRERTRAVADIQAAKASALDEVAQRSVDMAVALAGRIIQKQLNPGDHAKLISEAIEQFPSRN